MVAPVPSGMKMLTLHLKGAGNEDQEISLLMPSTLGTDPSPRSHLFYGSCICYQGGFFKTLNKTSLPQLCDQVTGRQMHQLCPSGSLKGWVLSHKLPTGQEEPSLAEQSLYLGLGRLLKHGPTLFLEGEVTIARSLVLPCPKASHKYRWLYLIRPRTGFPPEIAPAQSAVRENVPRCAWPPHLECSLPCKQISRSSHPVPSVMG
jgi:hypothetical protein